MFTISGFIEPSFRKYDRAYVDLESDFIVGSCGHTFIGSDLYHCTTRENGRADYQFLYVSKGLYCFVIGNREYSVPAGSAVLYYPNELQKYYSVGEGEVEIYWTHFTGSKCDEFLSSIGFKKSGVFSVGFNEKFPMLYKWIIKELQLKRENYKEISTGYFKQLLFLMSRSYSVGSEDNNETHLVEKAMLYFYRNFSSNISIDDFAVSQNITSCWFRRCFKKHTGVSPQQFITDIRLGFAREMLLTTDYKISEISERAGYQNAFYFSRIFAKNIGCSPIEYRKKYINK